MNCSHNLSDLLFLFIAVFFLNACDENEDQTLSASTSKTNYSSSEAILVTINNNHDQDVFLQECGGKIYSFYEKLDTIPSGGWVAVFVCRPLNAFNFNSLSKLVDTLYFSTGKYRLRYRYDFEDIDPEIFRKELYSNYFTIQ